MSLLDLSEVKEQSFEPPKPGIYKVQVTNSEVKTFGENDVFKKLSLVFTILEGDFENRKVFDDFIFEHSNPKAVNTGKQKLKNLTHCSNRSDVINSASDLVGATCLAKLKHETYNDKIKVRVAYFQEDKSNQESVFND